MGMSLNVLAFDPGGTTGYCLLKVIDNESAEVLAIGQFPEWSLVDVLINPLEVDVVVYEKFQFVTTHVNPIALEVTGAIKLQCKLQDVPIHYQTPSDRYFITKRYGNEFLKKYTSHHGDAFMHACTYAYAKMGCKLTSLIRVAPRFH
jgi:hypothetical protein